MFKNKNLCLYLLGRFVSFIGTAIQMIAFPLYILDLTGSGALMGVFSILTLVHAIINAPFSGVIGDRRNRRNIILSMDLGRGGLIFLLTFLAAAKSLNISLLFVAQIFISIMDSLFASSSASLMPELVSEGLLMKGYSIRGGLDGISFLIGPVLGGVIYGVWGVKTVFLVNAISFIFSAICLSFLSYSRPSSEKEKMSTKVFVKEAAEGLNFLKRNKGIFQITIFALLINFLLCPMFDIIMPYALKKEIGFSSKQFGYICGFYTLGIILGNLFINLLSKKISSKSFIKSALILEPIFLCIGCSFFFPTLVKYFGGASWSLFTLISGCCTIMGFCCALVNTPIATNTQKLVPNELRSRYNSISNILCQGAIPIGAFIFGTLLDFTPYYYSLIAICILSVSLYIVFLLKASEEVYEPR